MKKEIIKVLIVDDDLGVLESVSLNLSTCSGLEVVGTASSAYEARDKLLTLKPDVLVLDLHMPEVNGIEFLDAVMTYNSMPVIMMSGSLNDPKMCALAFKYGAADVVSKPFKISILHSKILSAMSQFDDEHLSKSGNLKNIRTNFEKNQLIVVGSSTGGPKALRQIVSQLPSGLPPMVIVQHMPQYYIPKFVENLNDITDLTVKLAIEGEVLQLGHVYIAMGGRHLVIQQEGSKLICHLNDGAKVNYQKPSVNVMFDSITQIKGYNILGVILTGMGSDGAFGLKKLNDLGYTTIAQSKESCVVFGMPKEAINLEAVTTVCDLEDMASVIIKSCEKRSK